MPADLRATPHLRGPSVVVEWTWQDEGERPGLRLVRRKETYPETAEDGRAVLDLDDLVAAEGSPWARVTRVRCLLTNSGAEDGLLEAELVLWFGAGSEPERARISWYAPQSGEVRSEEVDRIDGVVHFAEGDVETLILRVDDGGSPVEVGRVELAVSTSEGQLNWRPAQGRSREVVFHRCEVEHTTVEAVLARARRFSARWRTWVRDDPAPLAEALSGAQPTPDDEHDLLRCRATLVDALDPDSGDWRRRLSVTDDAVTAHTVAYYRAFVPGPEGFRTERDWCAWAAGTPRYGFEDRLFAMLPGIHQRFDDPRRGGSGQLRRFMSIFGLGTDHLRGHAEGLAARHHLLEANPEQLVHLSRSVGWEPDAAAPVRRQRSDVRFAPAVYDTVGTEANLRALIRRAVGWESRTKEFADNVALTNAPEPLHTWELWSAELDVEGLTELRAVTDATAFDGRPAVVVDADGEQWLFWESDRGGRRTIWLRGPDHADGPALDDAEELPADGVDEHPAAAVDAEGTVWLFWSSNRSGSRHIRRRRYPPESDGEGGDRDGEPVTTHLAPDAYPAVADDGAGGLWLFWQSARRGPTDIWCRHLPADGSTGEERRVTTAERRHELPAAVTDGDGRLWLFWVADHPGGRRLEVSTRDPGGWAPPETLHAGPWRDEAPCAVLVQGRPRLLWHSDRDGHWNLWTSHHDGASWPEPVRVTAHLEADKEPAAVSEAMGLRVWWRSQRSGARRRSRTLDTTDSAALASMGTISDGVHYIYDTGQGPQDWYARDTVGVALEPSGEVHDREAALQRIADYVERFQPLPVRLVWLSMPAHHEDVIDTERLIEEEHHDVID